MLCHFGLVRVLYSVTKTLSLSVQSGFSWDSGALFFVQSGFSLYNGTKVVQAIQTRRVQSSEFEQVALMPKKKKAEKELVADDGGPVATPERRPDASSESGKKPKKDTKSKKGDIEGFVGNRNLPSSSSDGRSTKCGCCQQTNKSRPFARDEGYVEAPADACLDHYLKWQPCSVFVTWQQRCRAQGERRQL